jgi:hypothetical protein
MVASGARSGSGEIAIVCFIAAQLGRLLVFFKKKSASADLNLFFNCWSANRHSLPDQLKFLFLAI